VRFLVPDALPDLVVLVGPRKTADGVEFVGCAI